MIKRILILLSVLISSTSNASVVINATRVVYHESAKRESVQLVNKSKTSHLIQAWIDDGHKDSLPEDMKTPFMVTPPVVKIDANSGQTLTISRFGDDKILPKDKEKVYWLNVIDVPPLPDDKKGGSNYLQVAIRSRIKLFWRPAKLTINYEDIPKNVVLKKNDKSNLYCIDNNTPYYLTVVQMNHWDNKSEDVMQIKKQDNLIKKSMFIEPYTCLDIKELKSELTSGMYQIAYLDDYGSKRPAVVKVP